MDGGDLELRDAGVAFEALHLAPRLAAGGPGVGDSDSESSSSDSSDGADSSGDSSDEDEAGGLDLLGPPPGKGLDHPSARLEARPLVLAQPFELVMFLQVFCPDCQQHSDSTLALTPTLPLTPTPHLPIDLSRPLTLLVVQT
jgi:hypothetical protein